MPTFSLDDLTTPSTKEQVQQSVYDVLEVLGVRTTSWKPGGVVRAMITGFSVVAAGFTQLSAAVARSGFLELAEKKWLTLKAYYDYKVERIEGDFATGETTLTNSGGALYTVGAEDLILRNRLTGKLYRNTAAFTLGSLSTVTIPIRAVEIGADSSAAPGDISELETPLTGVSCSNALALVGSDDESDVSLRERCSQKLGALSPFGPWDAYTSAVRGAKRSDGSSVGVKRVRVIGGSNGSILVVLATDTGPVSGTLGDTATDLGACNLAIQKYAAPQGITAAALSAFSAPIAITYQAFVYNTTGLSDAELRDLIAAKLSAFIAAQPVGGIVVAPNPGTLFQDAIRSAIRSARAEIFHVVVTSPAADVTLAPTQVATLGAVIGTITQVPPPEAF